MTAASSANAIFIHQIVGSRTTRTAQDGIHSFHPFCLQFKAFLIFFLIFHYFK